MFRATVRTIDRTMLSRQPLQRNRIIRILECGNARRRGWGVGRKREASHPTTGQGAPAHRPISLRLRLAARSLCAALVLLTSLTGCSGETGQAGGDTAATADCFDPGVRQTVERFGERLRQVSLLAPDSLVRSEIQSAYAEFVTPELLSSWTADPASAPGRRVSSPWPERIEVTDVERAAEGGCRVEGEVVYSASADAGPPTRVVLRLRRQGGWRIVSYEPQ